MSCGPKPMRGADVGDQLDADLGVVAGVALADVVQQRADHEQVGAVDPVDERGGVGRRLPQVPVDGEAVVGVALRLAADAAPTRAGSAPTGPSGRAPRPPGWRGATGQEQVDEQAPGLLAGHGVGERAPTAASRSSVRAVDAGVVLGGGDGRRAARAAGRPAGSAPAASVHLAVAQHHARGRASRSRPEPPAERARERALDAVPTASSLSQAIVRAAVDSAAHQGVGVGVAEGGGHGVLLLEQQPVAGAAGAAVQLDPRRQQRSRRRRRGSASSPSQQRHARRRSAQRRAWTSRRPPRPSFRSGSSRKATSPACLVARLHAAGRARSSQRFDRLRHWARPLVGELVGERRRRRRGGGPAAATVAVSRSSAARVSASFTVRTAWPSFRPSSQIGYQSRSASGADVDAAARAAGAGRCRCRATARPGRSRRRRRAPTPESGGSAASASSSVSQLVERVGQRTAERRAADAGVLEQRPAVELGGHRAPVGGGREVPARGAPACSVPQRCRRPARRERSASDRVGALLAGADADDACRPSVIQILPSPILPVRAASTMASATCVGVGVVDDDLDAAPWARSRPCTRRPGRPRCGRPGGRSPAPR